MQSLRVIVLPCAHETGALPCGSPAPQADNATAQRILEFKSEVKADAVAANIKGLRAALPRLSQVPLTAVLNGTIRAAATAAHLARGKNATATLTRAWSHELQKANSQHR